MEQAEVESLFREHFPLIRAKCARMLGVPEDAADVAQETFVRFCESGMQRREPVQRVAWIYRTSTRLAIDRLRGSRVRRAEPVDDVELPSDRSAADDVLAARQQLAALADEATRAELEVGVLCRIDGLTQQEASKVCGLSERTIRRLLTRLDDRVVRLRRSFG